jgi:hypothetical protein
MFNVGQQVKTPAGKIGQVVCVDPSRGPGKFVTIEIDGARKVFVASMCRAA